MQLGFASLGSASRQLEKEGATNESKGTWSRKEKEGGRKTGRKECGFGLHLTSSLHDHVVHIRVLGRAAVQCFTSLAAFSRC